MIERFHALGLSVRARDGNLVLAGLKALDHQTRAEVLALARKHKPEIIRELAEAPAFDLSELARLLRATGLALWLKSPYDMRNPVLVVRDPSGEEVDEASWNPPAGDAPKAAVKDYMIRHGDRAAREIVDLMRTKAYPPGLCEVCGAAGTWVEHRGRGFLCFSQSWHFGKTGGPVLSIEAARRNCPLAGRTLH